MSLDEFWAQLPFSAGRLSGGSRRGGVRGSFGGGHGAHRGRQDVGGRGRDPSGPRSRGERSFYTTPIKALSNQKFSDFVAGYGPERVGLLTGDNVINGDAEIVVMTTEVLRNMIYAEGTRLDKVGLVILDEVHYLQDRTRGAVWEEVIIHCPAAPAIGLLVGDGLQQPGVRGVGR